MYTTDQQFITVTVPILTPTNKRNDDNVLGGDLNKDDDQFLEHEQCLSSHPHH